MKWVLLVVLGFLFSSKCPAAESPSDLYNHALDLSKRMHSGQELELVLKLYRLSANMYELRREWEDAGDACRDRGRSCDCAILPIDRRDLGTHP